MDFNIGDAFSGAVNHVTKRMGSKLGMAALFTVLPLVLFFGVAAIFGVTGGMDSLAAIEAENSDPFSGVGAAMVTGIIVFYLVFIVMTILGQSALAALMENNQTNNFGEAMAIALRSLPTMIGVMLIAIVAYIAFFFSFGLIVDSLGAAGGILAFLLVISLFFVAIRFSITLPVIVLGGERNPLTALGRAWNLTGQDQWRLLGYYALIGIAMMGLFFVVALVIGGVFGATAAISASSMQAGEFGAGLIITGLIMFILYIAILLIFTIFQVAVVVSAYQQIVGSTSVADTFD